MTLFRKIFGGRGKDNAFDRQNPLEGVDAETIALAREIVKDREMERAFRRGRKRRSSDMAEDEFPGLAESRQQIVNRVFARTTEDTVLADRFVNRDGRILGGLTVRKAVAMDGLRDIEPVNGDVGVDPGIATPMNPEGRYRQPSLPKATPGFGDIGRRLNEALNPRDYADTSAIPAEILKHYAEFATFIGYPMCEVFAAHPTISNACSIPAKDAISPGYKLQFVDSEDIDGDGVPDENEDEGLAKVASALQKEKALASLNDALKEMGRPTDGRQVLADKGALLRELTLSIERLAAYEALAKDEGAPVETGSLQPLMAALHRLESEAEVSTKTRDAVYEATKDAVVALGVVEVKPLSKTKAEIANRNAARAVKEAVEAISRKREDQLTELATAVSRLGAYDEVSERNHALVAELGMALKAFSLDMEGEGRNQAFAALLKATAVLDADDFDFEGEEAATDGVASPKDSPAPATDPNAASPMGGVGGGGLPDVAAMAAQNQVKQMAAAQQKEAEEQKKKDDAKRKEQESKRRQKMLDMWKQRADDMGMNDICRKLAYNARVFGVGIAVPVVDDAAYDQPFDLAKIGKGSYHGFTIIEPSWIYPEVDSDDLINPLSPFFFEPMYWSLNTVHGSRKFRIQRIHRSWMVIVRHKEVPDMLRPMYYYGGIPLTQEIYEAVFCADKLMNEAPKLAMCKRTTVVKGDPVDFVANPEGLVGRLRARSQVQDNFGILYVGRNTDVQQLETSLSEFDEIISKANQRVASIAQMPETKLFKTQLAGMNSAGRYEWDDYGQLLQDIEHNWYTPCLQLHYKLDGMSQAGVPLAVKIEWNKIELQTEQEQDQVASGRQQRVNNAIQAGYLSPDEGRTIMRTHDDLFSALSAENPVEQQQQQPGGGMPGMGGGEGGGGMPDLGGLGGGIAAPGGGGSGGGGSPLDEPDAPKEPKAAKEKS